MAFPALGQAATITALPYYPNPVAVFQAAPGETNALDVTVMPLPPGYGFRLRFHDTGAGLIAGAGCNFVDVHTVNCPFTEYTNVYLGDGNDRAVFTNTPSGPFRMSSVASSLFGGPGNDKLVASVFGTWMHGEDGNDTIVGQAGLDELDGGTGNDRLFAVDGARDYISCGAGTDLLLADPVIDPHPADCETQ